jgi:hypothetical protein
MSLFWSSRQDPAPSLMNSIRVGFSSGLGVVVGFVGLGVGVALVVLEVMVDVVDVVVLDVTVKLVVVVVEEVAVVVEVVVVLDVPDVVVDVVGVGDGKELSEEAALVTPPIVTAACPASTTSLNVASACTFSHTIVTTTLPHEAVTDKISVRAMPVAMIASTVASSTLAKSVVSQSRLT